MRRCGKPHKERRKNPHNIIEGIGLTLRKRGFPATEQLKAKPDRRK